MLEDGEITIMVVDAHPLPRLSVSALITSQPGFELIAEANTAAQAIQLSKRQQPKVVLIDPQLPDMQGDDVIAHIKSLLPISKIIVLTTQPGDSPLITATHEYIHGILPKQSVYSDLVGLIRDVAKSGARAGFGIRYEEIVASKRSTLLPQEITLLKRLELSQSDDQIAADLGLTKSTVRSQIRELLYKLGAADRTHAVLIALKKGYLNK